MEGDCSVLSLSSPMYFPDKGPSPVPLSPPPLHVLSPHEENRQFDDNDDI